MALKLFSYSVMCLFALFVIVCDAITAARGQPIRTSNPVALMNDLMYLLASTVWALVALANFVTEGRAVQKRQRDEARAQQGRSEF
jgi:hypothetical protein